VDASVAVEPTDEDLLRRAAAGDRRAFASLVERHQGPLFRFAARTCGGEREAEDALQDGLLAAWRHAGTWRGEAAARTWLYQVVVNSCRRRLRRRSGEPSTAEPIETAAELPTAASGPEERLQARQASRAIEAALAEMSPEAREVLLLRDVEGLPGEEAAAVLGLGVPAMKTRLHRARLELKARVEARLGHAVEEVVP
jgi:RNA polymerase sigma-70 factor (ECF subfamily)